jgi:hypothetical protein
MSDILVGFAVLSFLVLSLAFVEGCQRLMAIPHHSRDEVER